VPLAFVLIAAGQTTIAATNILDARGALLPDDSPIIATGGGANITIPTFGASTIDASFNITASMTAQFTQVRYGSRFWVHLLNNSGSTFTFQMQFILADGVQIPTPLGSLIGGGAYTHQTLASNPLSVSIATASRYIFNCFASEAQAAILVQGQF
jgi:hypothetical protein